MKHTKLSRYSNLKLVGAMGSLIALMLPITGFSNPAAPATGNFPGMQAPQGYAPTAQQFPSMMQMPMQPAYQGYSYPSYGAMPWAQQRPAYGYYPYQQGQQNQASQPSPMNYSTPNYQFSNMTPFGNSFSPTSMFNNNNFPTPWSNSNNWNPWTNGNNSQMPFFPQQNNTNKKKAWGDVRNIWPDFYTEFTDEMWDKSTNGPYDMGRMPGGWRAPSLSSPDPVTVGDAVLNQFPPMMEEMGNMMDFSN
ncbi:MAG: hypothetical protein V3U78_10310 [Thiotrichaceae bacterium]